MTATSQQQSLLNQIAQNESGGNYTKTISPQTCQQLNGPGAVCTASGAYQMINTTWQMAAQAVGIDTSQYPTAASAPPSYQDTAALWLLQKYGPNATITWAESAPPGGYQYSSASSTSGDGSPVVDLTGDAASTSTSSIMDQLTAAAANVGVDLTDPTTGTIVGIAAIGGMLLLARVF